jgi:hypothetical protein
MLSGMMKKARLHTFLALAAVACLLAAGPVNAGYMDFTADSLQVADSGGC